MDYDKVDWDNFNVLLAEDALIDMEKVKLPITKDLYVEDWVNNKTVAVIKAQQYPFDETLGEHGGFKLNTVLLDE